MEYYIPVVQDYLAALKKRDSQRVQELWWHLLVLLGRWDCTPYVYPMLYSACHMEWLRRHNHTIWEFIDQNLAAFDEERGEVSFSMLRGCTIKDSEHGSRDKLALNYKLLPVVSKAECDFQVDISGWSTVEMSGNSIMFYWKHIFVLTLICSCAHAGEPVKPSPHWEIKHGSPEVQDLGQHFKKVIRSCVRGEWLNYGWATGKENFKSLPKQSMCEKECEGPHRMPRFDFYNGRDIYFFQKINKLQSLLHKPAAREVKNLDIMRRQVWGIEQQEWHSDQEDDEESDAEEDVIPQDVVDEEDESGDFVLALVQPLLPGDMFARF